LSLAVDQLINFNSLDAQTLARFHDPATGEACRVRRDRRRLRARHGAGRRTGDTPDDGVRDGTVPAPVRTTRGQIENRSHLARVASRPWGYAASGPSSMLLSISRTTPPQDSRWPPAYWWRRWWLAHRESEKYGSPKTLPRLSQFANQIASGCP